MYRENEMLFINSGHDWEEFEKVFSWIYPVLKISKGISSFYLGDPGEIMPPSIEPGLLLYISLVSNITI